MDEEEEAFILSELEDARPVDRRVNVEVFLIDLDSYYIEWKVCLN